jgi:hypothetical protein
LIVGFSMQGAVDTFAEISRSRPLAAGHEAGSIVQM